MDLQTLQATPTGRAAILLAEAAREYTARDFSHPRYWPDWLALVFLRMVAALPLPLIWLIGGVLGDVALLPHVRTSAYRAHQHPCLFSAAVGGATAAAGARPLPCLCTGRAGHADLVVGFRNAHEATGAHTRQAALRSGTGRQETSNSVGCALRGDRDGRYGAGAGPFYDRHVQAAEESILRLADPHAPHTFCTAPRGVARRAPRGHQAGDPRPSSQGG